MLSDIKKKVYIESAHGRKRFDNYFISSSLHFFMLSLKPKSYRRFKDINVYIF
jgi:hypothetical protein